MRLLSLFIVCLAVAINASPIQGNVLDIAAREPLPPANHPGHIKRAPQSGREDIKRAPQSGREDIKRTPQSGREDIKRDPQSGREDIKRTPQTNPADRRRTAENIAARESLPPHNPPGHIKRDDLLSRSCP
ncbi:hypothetical protein BC834DRAFT_846333 [Gloeopeniophorella convolvens]|nr:hypothetical protein BC834DRAFT_846333 [Gloeopeniophorella convolvens]